MVTHSRAPVRVDRLRALNVPVRVLVRLDERGVPVEVGDYSGRGGSPAQPNSTPAAERQNSSTDFLPAAPAAGVEGAGGGAAAGWCGEGVGPAAGVGRRRVEEVLEIWRIDDEWWRRSVSRRYIEVALKGGGHVVLFEDLVTGDWFCQMP